MRRPSIVALTSDPRLRVPKFFASQSWSNLVGNAVRPDAWARRNPLGASRGEPESGEASIGPEDAQLSSLPVPGQTAEGSRDDRGPPSALRPPESVRGEGAKGTAHGSSAFDAMLTAEVFLMEVDRWIRSADGGASRKRRRKSTQAAPDAEDGEGAWTTVGAGRGDDGCVGLASPAYLESHAVCRRFQNRLAIVAASPGFIDLGRPSGLSAAAPAHPEAAGGGVGEGSYGGGLAFHPRQAFSVFRRLARTKSR